MSEDVRGQVIDLRNKRYSYPEIAKLLNIHPERARAIYRRNADHNEHISKKETTYSTSENSMQVSHTSDRIMSLDELLDVLEIDRDVWEIQRTKVHKGEMARRHEIKDLEFDAGRITGHIEDSGTMHVEPIFNITVWLIRKRPIPIDPVVSPATAITITDIPYRQRPERVLRKSLILPDVHVGFSRDIVTGELTPFHDRTALDIVLQVARSTYPDVIVFLGDIFDLADWTDKFMRTPEFYWTTQSAVIEAFWWLSQFRRYCPRSKIYLLEGNHDRRMETLLINHMIAAYQLKSADRLAFPPALSVANLLSLDALDIEYVGDYPNGKVWLNEAIVCTHGKIARAAPGGTVSAVLKNANVSEIHGHIHRREWVSKTIHGRYGTRTVDAFSPGCLCRIDGVVPAKNSENNWQQGFAVVDHDDEDIYSIRSFAIENSSAIIDGEIYIGKDNLKQIESDTNWTLA